MLMTHLSTCQCHQASLNMLSVYSRMVRVVFLHPDLGIGGAERLVVDAAVALRSRGCSVQIWTAHHDPTHCFSETLDPDLNVVGVYNSVI